MTKRTLLKITSRNVTVLWLLKMMKSGRALTWESLRTARYKTAQIKLTNNIQTIIAWVTRTEWATVFRDEETIAP